MSEKKSSSAVVSVKFSKSCTVAERMYRKDEIAGFDEKIAKLVVEQKFGEIVKKS